MSRSPEAAPRTKKGSGVAAVFKSIGKVLAAVGIWIFRLRKIFLAIPVLAGAIYLAFYNMGHLPEQVGLNLQASGAFAQTISRNLAVVGPFGITTACLLLMLCARRVLYPWLISLFSLVLPIVLLMMNSYPM